MRIHEVLILAAMLCLSTRVVAADPGISLLTRDGPVAVESWGYQLQGPPPQGDLSAEVLAASAHDLLVIDYARRGDGGSRFTPAQIEAIQNRPGGGGRRRVVAAYLSIGEASDFRDYWIRGWTGDGSADSPLTPAAPGYLGPVNPDYPESRKARYWQPDWQAIFFNQAYDGYLDQIVDQGFDAAYLDIVDAYYFWAEEASNQDKRPGDPTDSQDAARRMIDLIVRLTAHARRSNPAFFVIPQNGAFILNDADFAGPLPPDPARRAAYLDAIGGIGVEDLYFRGDLDQNNPFRPDHETVTILQQDFLREHRPVFVVDYISSPAKVGRFFRQAAADGFLPYAAPRRDLDRLAIPVTTDARAVQPAARRRP